MSEQLKVIMTDLEKKYDWKNSISYYESIKKSLDSEDRKNLSIRVLFLITYWFLEGQYTEDDQEKGMLYLRDLYGRSLKDFGENADFLFCIGVITKLNESAFDLDLGDPDKFLSKAIESAPDIKLYQNWFVVRNERKSVNKDYLQTDFVKKWKQDKGLLGKYVVDFLQSFE